MQRWEKLEQAFKTHIKGMSEEELDKFQNKVIMEQYEQILTDLGFTFQQVNKYGGKDFIKTYTKYIETNIIEVYLISLINNSMQVTKHTDGGYGNTAETMQFTINPDTMPVILNSILSL